MTATKKTILIIDDDADFRDIVAAKLTAKGFAVEQAGDGQEGLAMAKKIMPDLVLLDVQMPKMNGIETISKMKEDAALSSLRVLFLTNYGEAESKSAAVDDKFAKDIGAVGHMRKAEDFDQLVSKINEILSAT